ncbi:heterokaryon incompatibility protein-domain-containing protein [Phaeosphaeriaceae sp. PMI808]|nr:heterokaryon incompatibility protein-domain-containing protein [Phaeosphaeriaceae sp. PMI808]
MAEAAYPVATPTLSPWPVDMYPVHRQWVGPSAISMETMYCSVEAGYCRSSRELYESVLDGCGWCSNLAKGVLRAAHLDYWMERWNDSASDGSELMDGLDEDESMQDCQDFGGPPGGNLPQEDGDGSEVEENDDDIEDAGGELTLTLSDLKNGEDSGSTLPLPKSSSQSPLGSKETFEQARMWMKACAEHAQCRSVSHPDESTTPASSQSPSSRKPTHLIDIRNAAAPKLVPHQSLSRPASYLALSYVWGGPQAYILTKGTVKEKCRDLDLSQIPQTILDAITVAKELEFSFLWVDALCIIQDDPKSQLNEIAAMGRIYRDSTLTLIAAKAQSSTEGFLKVPDPPSYFAEPFEVPLSTDDGDDVRLLVGYRASYKPYRDPINSRAWTLQERLLSQCCLLYSYDGPKWICRTCEINPSAPPEARSMFPDLYLNDQTSTTQETAGDRDDIDEILRKWHDIRNEYTLRRLTNGQDKLPAISAMAAEIARVTGWTYLAGLWREDLFNELHWRSDSRSSTAPVSHNYDVLSNPLRPRPAQYRAPSWSWASVDCIVIGNDDSYGEIEAFDFCVLSCDIEHQTPVAPGEFPFAPIVKGTLTVEGRAVEVDWRWKDAVVDDLTLDAELLVPDDETSGWGDVLFDAKEEDLEPGFKVCCLVMSVLKSTWHRWPVEGLVLVAAGEGECYRRVGFFSGKSAVVFEKVGIRRLTII